MQVPGLGQHPVFNHFYVFGRCPLLRGENPCSPFGPYKGRIHVAEQFKLAILKSLDTCNTQHAGATVADCAAAKADDKVPATAPMCG